jgi:3-hydroxypropanoate dehydrogenase
MLSPEDMDLIFRAARSHNGWQAKPVSDEQLHALYELMKWAPTTMNTQPARILFLRSREAKERLKAALDPGNVAQTMAAPATAIIAYDLEFYEKLPQLVPHRDARTPFIGKPELIRTTALQSGTLQGAYLVVAARALGLDCGPMGGFDAAKVDSAFFPDGKVKSNFLCNLGHGDPATLHPRAPRLAFDQACRIE